MDLIKNLQTTGAETLAFFDLPAEDLAKTYAPGKWTVREILIHIADADSVMHERIKRVIAEPKQVIWAFDQDNWCKNLDYRHFPIAISKALFDATRRSIIFLAEQYYASHGQRPFVHSETGLRTLQDEFDKIAWHNAGHLDQIRQALG